MLLCVSNKYSSVENNFPFGDNKVNQSINRSDLLRKAPHFSCDAKTPTLNIHISVEDTERGN